MRLNKYHLEEIKEEGFYASSTLEYCCVPTRKKYFFWGFLSPCLGGKIGCVVNVEGK